MKKVFSSRRNRIYFYGIIIFMILSLFSYWERELNVMNTTVFVFNYNNGFMSRGIMGNVLDIYNNLVSYDAYTYDTIFRISELATAIYYFMILWFTFVVISRIKEEQLSNAKWVMLVMFFLAVPMFVTQDNFGRLDVYLMIITLFCLILLMIEKAEFLIIPAVTLAGLIHEGFVFMNLNIILVLLLYKCIIKTEKKDKIKYGIYFALTLAFPSIIFLYCEFFSHTFGIEVFNDAYALAEKISYNNYPHKEVLLHEILGVDIHDIEWKYQRWNWEDTPIFLILFSPYIVFLINVFVKYVKTGKNNVDKFISFIVLAAPLTIIPEFILKVDYGRYMFAILFYYLAVSICLLVMNDTRVEQCANYWKDIIVKNKIISILGIAYLFMFIPFKGFRICDVVSTITKFIFKN